MALLNTKEDKEQFLTWITALKSGEYKQATYMLEDTNRYCCLGVACKVLIPEDKQLKNADELIGATPVIQSAAPTWLKIINEDFMSKKKNPFPMTPDSVCGLTTLNDLHEWIFDQIADALMTAYQDELDAIQ